MLLIEELGELEKAIRKSTNGHLDIAKRMILMWKKNWQIVSLT